MTKKKQTYEEWQESKQEARNNFHLTESKKNMANCMYLIMQNHKGEHNVICADAIAEQMTEKLQRDINRGHVSECARLFRDTGRFPGLQSCTKGYYVDDSLGAMLNTLRFVANKFAQIEYTATNIRNIIANKHGDAAVPDDLREWLRQIEFEEWCEENEFEPSQEWCWEHGYNPIY